MGQRLYIVGGGGGRSPRAPSSPPTVLLVSLYHNLSKEGIQKKEQKRTRHQPAVNVTNRLQQVTKITRSGHPYLYIHGKRTVDPPRGGGDHDPNMFVCVTPSKRTARESEERTRSGKR